MAEVVCVVSMRLQSMSPPVEALALGQPIAVKHRPYLGACRSRNNTAFAKAPYELASDAIWKQKDTKEH